MGATEHEFEQSVTQVNSIRPGRMVNLQWKDEARLGREERDQNESAH